MDHIEVSRKLELSKREFAAEQGLGLSNAGEVMFRMKDINDMVFFLAASASAKGKDGAIVPEYVVTGYDVKPGDDMIRDLPRTSSPKIVAKGVDIKLAISRAEATAKMRNSLSAAPRM